MEKINVMFKKLYDDALVPTKSHENDAGFDCYINNFKHTEISASGNKRIWELESNVKEVILSKGDRMLCGLGFAMAVPDNFYTKLVPRSGLALWHGISITNSPGTIDSGYRNEVGAIVHNLGKHNFTLEKNMRICQIIVEEIKPIEAKVVKKLPESVRNLKGFGSTGI